jgi:hypothetical protein
LKLGSPVYPPLTLDDMYKLYDVYDDIYLLLHADELTDHLEILKDYVLGNDQTVVSREDTWVKYPTNEGMIRLNQIKERDSRMILPALSAAYLKMMDCIHSEKYASYSI